MSLLDDLKNPDLLANQTTQNCKLCLFVESLEKDEANLLTKQLKNNDIPAASIGRILRKNNVSIHDSSVRRHRRECLNVIR